MVVKNFVFNFRQDWVDRKVAGMKKIYFCHFWPYLDPQKAQIRNFLNSILIKKDRNYIIINFVTLRLTNYSEIIEYYQFFCQFWPKLDKI